MIAVKVIAGSQYRTIYPIRERITKPWRQHISSRQAVLPPILKHMMTSWRKSQHVFVETAPQTPCEALSIDFWYPNGEGATAKRFSCESWRNISSGAYGRADLLGDIWDPISNQPRIQRDRICTNSEWKLRNEAVSSLIQSLSQQVLAILKETTELSLELFREQRTEFCPIMLPLGRALIPLRCVKHKILYSSLLHAASRKEAEKVRVRITPLLDLIHEPSVDEVKIRESIWRGARSKLFLPKASDFIWRMLHGRNIYGDRLKGPLKDRGVCDLCNVVCTEHHLLIECPKARELWETRRILWLRMGGSRGGYTTRPATVNKLKLMLCRPRIKTVHDRSRHLILTSLLVWVLWKSGTRQWYDNEPSSKESVLFMYRQLILEQMQVDRIECETSQSAEKTKKLDNRFSGIWGLARREVAIGGTPKYLRAI
jgi:hypothetical protein